LATFTLLFAPIIAVSTLGEPPFVATGEDIRAFYANVSAGWAQTARTVTCLTAIGLVWFVVGLVLIPCGRRYSPGPGRLPSPRWRSSHTSLRSRLSPLISAPVQR
jgi:hypothetical protein